MAYREFKRGEKARWYSISKTKIRGHHVVTPFRSKPSPERGQVIVSGTKHKYAINKNGYAVTKKLPEAHKTKKRTPKSWWW